MSYKTILVHVDESENLDARTQAAAQIAAAENAHLIGLATTGISKFLFQTVTINPADPNMAPYLDMLRQRAENAQTKFEQTASRVGATSIEKRLTDDEPAIGIGLLARYCDLIVLGQRDPAATGTGLMPGFPESAIMSSGTPALVVPYAWRAGSLGNRVLIAWNASVEAARAVHGAIPLLQRAKTVEVAIFNPLKEPDVVSGELPGAGIKQYLARHNIKADVQEEASEGDVGEALLSLAANLGSDLLVMGCYGHSRFREILLGGATRKVLSSMPLPVLMTH
jgi:nucleotide-binding universal stress UspA family protein